MNEAFNFTSIEQEWSTKWYDHNLYRAIDNDLEKPKKYFLVEFPYPSGDSLHVGHVFRYTVPDVFARFYRMKGYNVLYPIGFDSFGLPTEERARKEGKNPVETTRENIKTFKSQLRSMGYSFDWEREFSTTDPEYYKWTQWIFKQLFNAGLVTQQEVDLWWCPAMATVLANEEVVDGGDGMKVSERGEHPVEKRKMLQWTFKITDYAQKLLDGLNTVQWPEFIKDMQRNWIGKSEGAEITWKIVDEQGKYITDLVTFTTRKDTIPGVTFLAIAPEHESLMDLVNFQTKETVETYRLKTESRSERERQTNKEKSGVFTGAYAINPFNDTKVPIYTSDYVLAGYGTGVVMGMPGHDERDREFANKFNLNVFYTTKRPEGWSETKIFSSQGIQENSGEGYDGLSNELAGEKIGKVLESKGLAKNVTNYKLRDWIFSRQRYWGEPFPFEYLKTKGDSEMTVIIQGEEYFVNVLSDDKLPLILPEVADYEPHEGQSPLSKTEWINVNDLHGKIIGKHESDTMPNWAGSSWYYLRFTDPKNSTEFASQENMNYWLPVDHYFGGNEHTTLHLLYSRFWNQALYDLGHVPVLEPYTMRTNGGILLASDGTKMSKSKGNVISPLEKIDRVGADALRLYINFIGPYDATVAWQEGGLVACKKLLDSIYNHKLKLQSGFEDSKKVISALHSMIRNVSQMIETQKSNVAVSELMIFNNLLKEQSKISTEVYNTFLKVLAPFAPFITEELWYSVNNLERFSVKHSIHLQAWPDYDPELCIEESVTMVVQINGKVRAEFETSKDNSQEEVISLAKHAVLNWTEGKTISFVKVVPNKLVTIVVKD
jgi:leucyl-tRNA synthetase